MIIPPASSGSPDFGNTKTLIHDCIHVLKCDINDSLVFHFEKEILDLIFHAILCIDIIGPIDDAISLDYFIDSQGYIRKSIIKLVMTLIIPFKSLLDRAKVKPGRSIQFCTGVLSYGFSISGGRITRRQGVFVHVTGLIIPVLGNPCKQEIAGISCRGYRARGLLCIGADILSTGLPILS